MKKQFLESFLQNLSDYYNDNPEVESFINDNLFTPSDIEVFALKNNISLNYKASEMEATVENFTKAIDKEIKKLYG
jgi:hypothetical protein